MVLQIYKAQGGAYPGHNRRDDMLFHGWRKGIATAEGPTCEGPLPSRSHGKNAFLGNIDNGVAGQYEKCGSPFLAALDIEQTKGGG